MPKPTPEQIEEFKKWEKENPNQGLSAEVVRSVIDDDVKEAAEIAKKRLKWDRGYNHAPEKMEKRYVAE